MPMYKESPSQTCLITGGENCNSDKSDHWFSAVTEKKKRNTIVHQIAAKKSQIDCGCLILPMSNMARSSLGVPPRSSRAPRLNSVAPWHRAAPGRRRWEALWATGGFWRSWESWAARQHKATLWKWHKVVAHGELSMESLGFRLIVTLTRV